MMYISYICSGVWRYLASDLCRLLVILLPLDAAVLAREDVQNTEYLIFLASIDQRRDCTGLAPRQEKQRGKFESLIGARISHTANMYVVQ